MKNVKGFTLVELSIVLVITGLIVSGIVGGISLVNSAKIKSAMSEAEALKLAVQQYGMQYDAIPGDHKDAYDWFDGSGGSAVCGNNDDLSSGCNGDGDGIIESSGSIGHERNRALQHLGLAELIKPFGYSSWMPSSYADGSFLYLTNITFYNRAGDPFILNSVRLSRGDGANMGVVTPEAAKKIDKKRDDGLALSGDIQSRSTASHECHHHTSPNVYYLDHKGADCVVYFGF